MKKNLLNLVTISATALFLTCNANAKDFDYKTAFGVGFGQQTVKGSFLDSTTNGTFSDSDFAINSSSDVQVFDFVVEGKFKLFNKFVISPQARIPVNDQIENNVAHNDSILNSFSATNYNEAYNLNQKFSTDYILDLKLGYLVNDKTSFYGSVGYIKSNSKTNVAYSDTCVSYEDFCVGESIEASTSINESWSTDESLMTYGVGLETEIKNNLLLDVNYLFSEKQDYNPGISGTDSLGNTLAKRFSGNYQYNKLSVALKYLF